MCPKKQKEHVDYTVKIVIVGDSGVGKTNILSRFCGDQFKASYVATIGVDFKTKVMSVGDRKIKLQIWDTAGQQRFKNINQTYFKGAAGVILTYSINNQGSLDSIQNWMKQINEHCHSDIIKVLVGNKLDLQADRKVTKKMGESFAQKYQIPFKQVSAKDGTNLDQLFNDLAQDVYQYIKNQIPSQRAEQKNGIALHQAEQNPKEGGCGC